MSREVYFNDCAGRRDGYLNIDLFSPSQSLADSNTGNFKNSNKTCRYLLLLYIVLTICLLIG